MPRQHIADMPGTDEVDKVDEVEQDFVVIPAMLRAARGAYGDAVRARLAEAGFEDLPRNGPYVISGIANRGGTPATVVRELRISKQAASQLIDTLVLRDYLERRTDPEDRRRMGVRLTERGRVGALAAAGAVEGIEASLAKLVTGDELRALRTALAAYRVIREESGD
jgi:DNA-binding MarR family transcriptional regulator